jgi:hypothetical protein
MTLQEAIESGKPFRRRSWPMEPNGEYVWYTKEESIKHFPGYMSVEDLANSTNWILKYECNTLPKCNTCKDTKKVIKWKNETNSYLLPCPDCSTPKYKCNTCKDTGLILGMREKLTGELQEAEPCPDCSAPKLKLEVNKLYKNGWGDAIRIVKKQKENYYIGDDNCVYNEDGRSYRCAEKSNLETEVNLKDEHPKMKLKFINGCDRQAIKALRYIVKNKRPAEGGEQNFNTEHLFQIADELEKSVKDMSGDTSEAKKDATTAKLGRCKDCDCYYKSCTTLAGFRSHEDYSGSEDKFGCDKFSPLKKVETSKQKLQLEVGKTYLDRKGNHVYIVRKQTSLNIGDCYISKYHGNFGEDGHTFSASAYTDLISEVKDTPPKTKKITVYVPLFDKHPDNPNCYWLVYEPDPILLYKKKSGFDYGRVYFGDWKFVGWEPKEIEVLDEEASK